jgi:methyl coenzyme M reductase subunit C
MERGLCVQTQIAIRRVQRHPVTKKTIRRIEKHVVKGTAIGLVPSAINDIFIHHAPIDFGEFVHVTQDTLAVTILNLAITVATKMIL